MVRYRVHKQAASDKVAMAILLPDVAHLNWGFYSERENRMHLQTIGGDVQYKVWLERDGQRACIPVQTKKKTEKIPGKIFHAVENAVYENRTKLERYWVNMLIQLGSLVAAVDPSTGVATITIYPNSTAERKMTKKVAMTDTKDHQPGNWKLDHHISCLVTGLQHTAEEDHNLFYLPYIIWGRLPEDAMQ